MRVALIASTLPPEGRGGAEAYVAELAATLRDRHDVLVLSGASTPGITGVEHVTLPHLRPTRHDDPAAFRMLWHARDQWRPSVHRAAVREMRRFRADVVHTHEIQGLSAAVYTAVEQVAVPHVHTAHDLNLLCVRTSMTKDGRFCGGECRDCRVQRTIRGGVFRRHIDHFIAVSDYIRDRHVEACVVPSARASTVRLGVRSGSVRLREPSAGRLRLGYIGTLAPHKGVRTLLAAFADAPEGWTLALAGSGSLEAEVRAAAAADARITVLGHVGGDVKEAFFDGLDLLVVPSEWEEPAALTSLEAAVRGLPSVVTNRGGLPENPGVKVFEAGDRAALLEAIGWYAEDPRRLTEVSAALIEARTALDWTSHVERVEAVFERVCGERRCGS
jgi:glycosyltransferase involved in cell wall biosynthesis